VIWNAALNACLPQILIALSCAGLTRHPQLLTLLQVPGSSRQEVGRPSSNAPANQVAGGDVCGGGVAVGMAVEDAQAPAVQPSQYQQQSTPLALGGARLSSPLGAELLGSISSAGSDTLHGGQHHGGSQAPSPAQADVLLLTPGFGGSVFP
jgi:hypothetical protein